MGIYDNLYCGGIVMEAEDEDMWRSESYSYDTVTEDGIPESIAEVDIEVFIKDHAEEINDIDSLGRYASNKIDKISASFQRIQKIGFTSIDRGWVDKLLSIALRVYSETVQIAFVIANDRDNLRTEVQKLKEQLAIRDERIKAIECEHGMDKENELKSLAKLVTK